MKREEIKRRAVDLVKSFGGGDGSYIEECAVTILSDILSLGVGEDKIKGEFGDNQFIASIDLEALCLSDNCVETKKARKYVESRLSDVRDFDVVLSHLSRADFSGIDLSRVSCDTTGGKTRLFVPFDALNRSHFKASRTDHPVFKKIEELDALYDRGLRDVRNLGALTLDGTEIDLEDLVSQRQKFDDLVKEITAEKDKPVDAIPFSEYYCHSDGNIKMTCPYWMLDPFRPHQENGICLFSGDMDYETRDLCPLLWDQIKVCSF